MIDWWKLWQNYRLSCAWLFLLPCLNYSASPPIDWLSWFSKKNRGSEKNGKAYPCSGGLLRRVKWIARRDQSVFTGTSEKKQLVWEKSCRLARNLQLMIFKLLWTEWERNRTLRMLAIELLILIASIMHALSIALIVLLCCDNAHLFWELFSGPESTWSNFLLKAYICKQLILFPEHIDT